MIIKIYIGIDNGSLVQTKKSLVQTKKSLVRMKKSLVRTKKSLIRTKKSLIRIIKSTFYLFRAIEKNVFARRNKRSKKGYYSICYKITAFFTTNS